MISSKKPCVVRLEKFTCGRKELILGPGYLPSCTTNTSARSACRCARVRGVEPKECDQLLTLAPHQGHRQELRDLERAIAKLPEDQRSVILLVGLEGMRYDEAASVLNVPVGTVRSRVARGRETLRILTGLFPRHHSPRAP
jgi:DNA-directed RNA polymerase specialized sigma24 family protein